MRTIRIVVPIIIAVVVLKLTHKPIPRQKSPKRPPNRPSRALPAAYLPLEKGNIWEYKVRHHPRIAKTNWKVTKVSANRRFDVLESANGKQTESFRFERDEAGAIYLRPYAMGKARWLYLPADLKPEKRWQIRKTWRASAEETEEIPIPGAAKLLCLRIRYEAFYDKNTTKHPGWYPDGIRWYAKGIGLVREDLRPARVPRDLKGLEKALGGLKELVFYKIR